MTRTEATAKKGKTNQVCKIKFSTTYNSNLPKTSGVITKYFHVLHSDDTLQQLLPANMFNTIYKHNENLKEILASSKYPNHKNRRLSAITSCKKWEICRNYMTFDKTFKCTVLETVYFKGEMNWQSKNVIYLVSCIKCLEYVSCAINFTSRFPIHKSDIKLRQNVVRLPDILICFQSSNRSIYLSV